MQCGRTIRTASSWEPVVLQQFASVLQPVHGQPSTCLVSMRDASRQMGPAGSQRRDPPLQEKKNGCISALTKLASRSKPRISLADCAAFCTGHPGPPPWPHVGGLYKTFTIERQPGSQSGRYSETRQRCRKRRAGRWACDKSKAEGTHQTWQHCEAFFEGEGLPAWKVVSDRAARLT